MPAYCRCIPLVVSHPRYITKLISCSGIIKHTSLESLFNGSAQHRQIGCGRRCCLRAAWPDPGEIVQLIFWPVRYIVSPKLPECQSFFRQSEFPGLEKAFALPYGYLTSFLSIQTWAPLDALVCYVAFSSLYNLHFLQSEAWLLIVSLISIILNISIRIMALLTSRLLYTCRLHGKIFPTDRDMWRRNWKWKIEWFWL